MMWPTVPLGEVAPPNPSKIKFKKDDPVWLLNLDQIESTTGYVYAKTIIPAGQAGSSTHVFDPGNVLYSKLRPYLNKVVWPQQSGMATTELVPFRPHPEVLECPYLAYYLRSDYFLSVANHCTSGAQLPRASVSKLLEHPIPLPPLSEQRRIVEILDQADALRRKRTEADAKAARILPALFYQMFGDPVTNPMGWPIVEMRELFAIPPNYGTMTPAKDNQGQWHSIRVTNIQNGALDISDNKYVDLPDQLIQRHGVQDRDLLIVRAIGSRTLLGKCVVAYPGRDKWAFDSHLIRVRLRSDLADPEMIRGFLVSPGGRSIFLANTRNSAVQFNININELGAIQVPLPPISLQRRFAACVTRLKGTEETRGKSRCQIDNLFQSLLHRAFSGDLTAGWREAHLQELLAEMEHQASALGAGRGTLT